MKRDHLRDIEKAQKVIMTQQARMQEDLDKIKAESFLIMQDIQEIRGGEIRYLSPELEKAVKAVLLRAHTLDDKVEDLPPE